MTLRAMGRRRESAFRFMEPAVTPAELETAHRAVVRGLPFDPASLTRQVHLGFGRGGGVARVGVQARRPGQ
ncbi:hypothetical protein Q8W71_21295 [Methylobacterium sp. NEAU 140]|uniref:hypothetical protein n=1 Tax=Methylobacterium sp. NEAU 140 TaxID=3064945 RepID=UPI0027376911|nr:hypothetical protein [Methylobacterium sp. NEAU 140]MDP4025171.1 hypothetical protein [Methylobacterium sp. NEAU 140]